LEIEKDEKDLGVPLDIHSAVAELERQRCTSQYN